jgi:hypothetical protein
MHEINRVITAAAWRLALGNFVRGFVACLAGVLGALILARVVERLFGLAYPWPTVAYAAAGLTVLGGIAWAVWSRPSRAAVARRVDEGAGLKEAISTALAVAPNVDDPWARVTVESAVRSARGVRVRQAVPIAAPRFWPVVLALGLALGVVWFAVPKMDVLGWRAASVAAKQKDADIVLAKASEAEVKQMKDELEKKLGLDKDKDKLDGNGKDRPETKDPEAIRRSAIKDLTSLKERLEQLRQGEKGQKLEAVEKNLKNLKSPGEQTSELSKAMASGDFKKAEEEVGKLKEKLGEGKLSDEQKKELSEQLDNLAKQLSEMARNKQDLERKLKEAGVEAKAGATPEEVKKAIEQAKNLSEEQKQQLKEAAQSMAQCQSAMDKLSEAASKMAQSAKQGDQAQMQRQMEQAAQQMQGELNQLEQLQQEMSLAEAAQNECQSKIDQMGQCNKDGQCNGGKEGDGKNTGMASGNRPGQKPWEEGWSQQENGSGQRGGPGRGQGGSASVERAEFDHEKKKDIGKMGNGPIVSTRTVEGESLRGESTAELVHALSAAEQRSSEAIENQTIPREFQDAVKHYFSTKPKGAAAADAKDGKDPKEPAKPAQPAQDAGKK